MTAAELIANTRRILGNRNYHASCSNWVYNHRPLSDPIEVTYTLYIKPGIKGDDGEHYTGESYEAVAERIGELVADQLMASGGCTDEQDTVVINEDGRGLDQLASMINAENANRYD